MRRQHLLIQSGLLIVSLVLAGTMTMAWAYSQLCQGQGRRARMGTMMMAPDYSW
jgi:F0F1-type ATP synthase assembly protein I